MSHLINSFLFFRWNEDFGARIKDWTRTLDIVSMVISVF